MLDCYTNARCTHATPIDAANFIETCNSAFVTNTIERYRNGETEAKKELPAVTYMGISRTGHRKAADMKPTGLVMLDVDHIATDEKLHELHQHLVSLTDEMSIVLIHITPSGRGMRIVCRTNNTDIVSEQQRLAEALSLADFGDVDECVKDLSRLSFLPQQKDILYINTDVLFNHPDIDNCVTETAPNTVDSTNASAEDTDDRHQNEDFKYGDIFVRDIAAEYVKWKGEPVDGTRHHFYNRMVADFRNICNNSPEILVDVLPRFDESWEKRYSQCKSICSRNTTTLIPKHFWAWLKDKGYYIDPKTNQGDEEAEEVDAYAEEHELLKRMPTLPPVFREIVGAAPTEFKIPTIFALAPIMGTVATYLEAEFYDGAIHTPSFFTVIFAPAGSGKSFVNRFLELDVERSSNTNLMHEIVQRDFVANCRMNLWNEFSNAKGANDKGKPRPKVSSRLAETITSQADLLPVMKDNQGMHMFMFAPEIDTLIKGMKAGGGGDKNDIFRVAWDNGMYGQSYRNSVSFRGKVAMYLNVLATGTPAQCSKMFKDVENGLVTRCLFTDLGKQEYAKYQPWKKFTTKDLQVIDNWRRRCDAETYRQTLNFDLSTIHTYDDEESFDENVPWEYSFRGRTRIDMTNMNKKLLRWLEQQRVTAEKDADRARDAFRKRAAGNAFRIALLCYSCWKKVTKREEAIIEDFALWFADLALMKYLKRWRDEYNEAVLAGDRLTRRRTQNFGTLYDGISDVFTKGDLQILANKNFVKTPIRNVISQWKTANLIEKISANEYRKKRA